MNYFIGNDPKKWKTNIPTYQAVVYQEIYPGIDMKFYGNNRQMEYDIIVKPGADPSRVQLAYEGIEGLQVAKDGNLEISLKEGKIIQKKPVIYQETGGMRKEFQGGYFLNSKARAQNVNLKAPYTQVVGFQLAGYDREKPLIIDPVLEYSTYLGGSAFDTGYGIAVDGSGNAYLTGATGSTNFPTVLPIQGSNAGDSDVFVTKINTAGSILLYSTYLGGGSTEVGYGIAVDGLGNAYLTGATGSTNFPTVSPIQGSNAGFTDAFVTKINAAGNSLPYSTYLGGSSDDSGVSIAVDGSGNAYLTGWTSSTNFPTVLPIQGSNAGGIDAFVTKINAAGNSLPYSTYLGGIDYDYGLGIAVDGSGNAYLTGQTLSTNFPTALPIQGSNAGSYDAFVTKINAAGSSLPYSTYLGGSSGDYGYSIAVDGSGNAYLTGVTGSTNFPTASPIQGSNAGDSDVFVTKINTAGSILLYSTYLGGSSTDVGYGIAVDGSRNAYFTGYTLSTNFPTVSPIQGSIAGGGDAFVTKINAAGNSLLYSTYLGGSIENSGFGDFGTGIAVDGLGNAYLTGYTFSTNFPTVSPIQGSNAGFTDAFVAKIVSVTCGSLEATIIGTAGNDILTGTAGNDVIHGLGGDDTIDGLGGDDYICGGYGNDTLNGGDGNDQVFGQDGNDVLNGGVGKDRLFGGNGDDTMDGGLDNDRCDGGPHVTGDTAVNCEIVVNVP